jgi:hypothetical protein
MLKNMQPALAVAVVQSCIRVGHQVIAHELLVELDNLILACTM